MNRVRIDEERKPMPTLPEGSGIDWMLAANIPPEEVARLLAEEKRIDEVTSYYEKSMGYNPLQWGKLERLKKFLMKQTLEDIQTFAKWSRREYSTFTPPKARLFPDMVIDLWPQAFPEEKSEFRGDKIHSAVDAFLGR
jgi:hypothetical protein